MLRAIGFICVLLVAGHADQLERDFFFKHPRENRIERLRQYGLEDQYRIFRYGMHKIEPPVLGLANPIAEKGGNAVPFLTEKLRVGQSDTLASNL